MPDYRKLQTLCDDVVRCLEASRHAPTIDDEIDMLDEVEDNAWKLLRGIVVAVNEKTAEKRSVGHV